MQAYNYEPVAKPLADYYQEIASRIKWKKKDPPIIIFAIGTARSGTTASLNVFRGSKVEDNEGKRYDIPVAYQHFKAGLRHAMFGWRVNSEWSFSIPAAPLFYMKDTIGPYTDKESRYEPLKVFSAMGYPMDRIFPVFFYRDPLHSFASWIDKWNLILPRETLVKNFIVAAHTLQKIRRELKNKKIAQLTFLYETIRDNRPAEVVATLFDQINQTIKKFDGKKLVATENTTENWDRLDLEGWHPDQPGVYEIPRIDRRVHQDAKTKTSWEFKIKTPEELAKMITLEEVQRLEEAGIPQIYEEFRMEAQLTLGLPIREPATFREIKKVLAGPNAK